MIATTQTSMIKDPAYLNIPKRTYFPTTAPSALFEGPLVYIESINTQKGNVGASMDFDMREKRKAP